MEKLIFYGVIILFIGIILIFIGSFYVAIKSPEKSNIKVAAGGFIGPIPFGFFTDKKMFYFLIVLMIVALIIYSIMRR